MDDTYWPFYSAHPPADDAPSFSSSSSSHLPPASQYSVYPHSYYSSGEIEPQQVQQHHHHLPLAQDEPWRDPPGSLWVPDAPQQQPLSLALPSIRPHHYHPPSPLLPDNPTASNEHSFTTQSSATPPFRRGSLPFAAPPSQLGAFTPHLLDVEPSPRALKRRRVTVAGFVDEATSSARAEAAPTFAQSGGDGRSAAPSSTTASIPSEEVNTTGTSKVEKAEKSCKHCRIRKVRCSRSWPTCARCQEKGLNCYYGNLVPVDLIKNMNPDARVVELEARIKSLEAELHAATQGEGPITAPSFLSPSSSVDPSSFSVDPRLAPSHSLLNTYLPLSSDLTTSLATLIVMPLLSPSSSPAALDAHIASVSASVRHRAKMKVGEGREMEKISRADLGVLDGMERLGREEMVRTSEWSRWVVWGLLDAFFSACSSNVPTFRPFHEPARKLSLWTSLEHLSPGDRAVVGFFCAVGARSTSDLGLLGLAEPTPIVKLEDEDDGATPRDGQLSSPSLAQRRELLCRAIRNKALELYERLEVAHQEATREGLEATAVAAIVMTWNELIPRRSRSLVRTALGMFRDLIDQVEGDEEAKMELMMMHGLPLLHIDSTTAAYLRSAPLITPADLSLYFPIFPLPSISPTTSLGLSLDDDPSAASLAADLAPYLDVDRLGSPHHGQLQMASLVIYRWVSGCLRWIAERSCPKASSAPLSPSDLSALFSALAQIHATILILQHHLVHAPSLPSGCLAPPPDGCTCEHMHLRFLCRLDREVEDCLWLVYGTVGERVLRIERDGKGGLGTEGEGEGAEEGDRLDAGWLKASETRVRKGLKLAAFYFNLYSLSPDPHQTHHLAWSLELIPSWTFLATQRFIPPSSASSHLSASAGPERKSDELTETELDWIERGLEVARLYHPVAERRLDELSAFRRRRRDEALRGGGQDEGIASRAVPVPSDCHISFQEAVKVALRATVPSWA
ncbi:hypothetical protein JCM5296_002484 [Sporobolomyces johnsonii]